jgi:redox-sensing transcriptional repressor
MTSTARNRKVPQGAVERLCDYLRVLTMLDRTNQRTASSEEIGGWAGVKASQVRKDLSYFGEFGRRGLGYDIEQLRAQIRDILGVQRQRPTIVVGIGNLGSALACYPGFESHGFEVVALFDADPRRIGYKVNGMKVHAMLDLAAVARDHSAEIALLTVPEQAAQEVAEQVVAAGIRAIVNFAPVLLALPPEVNLRNVDLARELETLCFYLPPKE